MGLLSGLPSYVQFLILFIPFTVFIWMFAPSLKWKFLFIMCGAAGIILALAGRSMKGLTPVGRSTATLKPFE